MTYSILMSFSVQNTRVSLHGCLASSTGIFCAVHTGFRRFTHDNTCMRGIANAFAVWLISTMSVMTCDDSRAFLTLGMGILVIVMDGAMRSRIGHRSWQQNWPQAWAAESATSRSISRIDLNPSSRIGHAGLGSRIGRRLWRQHWPAWAAKLATSRGSRIDHKPKQQNWPRRPRQQNWPHAWAAELATGLGNRLGHRPGQQSWPQAGNNRIDNKPQAAILATSRSS
jgi:hypothetical protein